VQDQRYFWRLIDTKKSKTAATKAVKGLVPKVELDSSSLVGSGVPEGLVDFLLAQLSISEGSFK
jgi:hypothetical protein